MAVPLLVALIVFTFMIVEARRAAANERAQRARGGLEPSGDVHEVMRIAYPAAFLAMIAEGAFRGVPPLRVVTAGAALFVLSKALKWWAILALGPSWTFRIVTVPGASLVGSGPYRFIRHPNYLAVIGELVSVALLAGARITGPIATIGFGLLILRRIAVEERALGRVRG